MQTFQDWARNHGRIPNQGTTNPQIVTSVVDYLKAIVQEAHFWARQPANSLPNAVQLGLNIVLNARPAAVVPAPPPGAALIAYQTLLRNWGANLLQTINQYVTTFQATHAHALDTEVTRLNNAHPLASATAAIPSYLTYFTGVSHDAGIERRLVTGYIDYVIAAITAYVTTAVPHSNEMKRRGDAVKNQLGRCKADTFLGA
ncbi:MAG: hypothetical protein ACRD2P_13955, partial [Terriglobia bacterium]